MKKAIGIIGGMGPQASCELYRLLIEKSILLCQTKQDEDFPEIFIDSVPVPDIIGDKSRYESALSLLKERCKRLNSYNLDSISIACNTAHVFVPDLQEELGSKFISLIEAVAGEAKKQRMQCVGVLGTPVTIKSSLYQDALSRKEIRSVTPTEEDLIVLERIIRQVLAGKNTDQDLKSLLNIADSLTQRGAEAIILGCTELPLIFPKTYSLPVFDSLDILATTLLERYYQLKLI